MISVIIPTRNRADLLQLALQSLQSQTLPTDLFEILVIDNGSTDNTKQVLALFQQHLGNIRYYFEPTTGLHVGRNVGMKMARSDVLVYADDDIEAFPTWLEGISETFEDEDVVLVGGKNLPKFETETADWISRMWGRDQNGNRTLGYLSILDLGHEIKTIDPYHVYGCNFSIRKSILFQAGGFHPDAFPQKLIRFRGDGESHVSNYIQSRKLMTIYNPKASVYHWVPKMRMTVEYFCRRAYNQGISDSYTEVRKTRGTAPVFNQDTVASRFIYRTKSMLNIVRGKGLSEIRNMIWRKINVNAYGENSRLAAIRKELALAYKSGYTFHQRMLKIDPKLIEWVLRENYFGENGKLPERSLGLDV